MIRSIIIPGLALSAMSLAADPQDLLRFTNNDQLHGSFSGFTKGPQVVWRHSDVGEPVNFKTDRIHHIVLHGGQPAKSLGSLSNVRLINGDRIPGTIKAIEDDQVTIETGFAGTIRIPRQQVAMLAPNPLGGRLYYHGPFSEDGWTMKNSEYQAAVADEDDASEKSTDSGSPENANSNGRWKFSGSSWYWNGKFTGTALVRESGMPDRAILSFELAWKNRLNIAFAFNADFAKAKPKDKDGQPKKRPDIIIAGDPSSLPRLFGNSNVIQLNSNYYLQHRTSVDDDGNTSIARGQMNNNNLRLGDNNKAKVEIRSNRTSGEISMFINDEFVAQWNDKTPADDEQQKTLGSGFGFLVQSADSPVRISDVVVSEWNGMPDSARSLQMDDQDVVLMTNGTDRYAGKVGKLSGDNKIHFEGKHGNFEFPLEDIAEIRFARSKLATAAEAPANNVLIRMAPIGSISGTPVSGDADKLQILSPVMGDVSLSTDSAVMLEFNTSNQIIDTWDVDL